MKKIVYIDMDGVLVDFESGIDKLSETQKNEFVGRLDEVPKIFSLMEPMEGAIEAFNLLSEKFDCYILSTSPWDNSTALQNKHNWVKKYLEGKAHKRLIFSHHKNLNRGDYLIDDRPNNGAKDFQGEWLHFGKNGKYPNWASILDYLL